MKYLVWFLPFISLTLVLKWELAHGVRVRAVVVGIALGVGGAPPGHVDRPSGIGEPGAGRQADRHDLVGEVNGLIQLDQGQVVLDVLARKILRIDNNGFRLKNKVGISGR